MGSVCLGSGRLSYPFFLLVFSLLILGCESADVARPESSSSLSHHSFDNEVTLGFAVLTRDGLQEVHNEASLRRAFLSIASEQVIKAQGASGNAFASQLVRAGGDVSLVRFPEFDNSDIKAFNSASSNMLGVSASAYGLTLGLGGSYTSGSITYRYYPPASAESLTLLSYTGLSAEPQLLENTGSFVTVTVAFSNYRNSGLGYNLVDLQVNVDGASVLSLTDVQMPEDGEASVTIPFLPFFGSTSSGDFRIEVQSSAGVSGFAEYIQRGLTFQELLDYNVPVKGSVTITNSFSWDYGSAANTLQQPSWELEILNPDGVIVQTFTGETPQISATWDSSSLELDEPIRLKPANQAIQDGGSPIYGYRITAKALAYPEAFPGTSFYRPATFYEKSSSDIPSSLKFVNDKITPDPPFQNPGDSVQLTLEIVAIGYGDISENDVEWWVDLIDPSGNTVGDPLAMGTGFAVSATWDGRVGDVAVPNPNFYSFQVRVQVCSGEVNPQRVDIRSQVSQCGALASNFDLKSPNMTVSATVLEEVPSSPGVFRENSDQDVGLGLPPSQLNSLGLFRRKLLEDVHYIKKSSEGGYDVDIEAKLAFPDDVEPPEVLMIQARNMLTGVTEDIEADRMSLTKSGATYRAKNVNLSKEFVDTDTSTGILANTRYSIGEFYRSNAKYDGSRLVPGKRGDPGVTRGVTEAFISLIKNSGAFPEPHAYLGRFAETALAAEERDDLYPGGAAAPLKPPQNVPSNTPDLDFDLEQSRTVTSNPTNLLSPGFVSIEFSVKPTDAGTDNRNPEELTPVYVKVPRIPGETSAPGSLSSPSPLGPNVVLWTFHGDKHDLGTVRPSSDYDRSVQSGKRNWELNPSEAEVKTRLQFVDTLILTGCSILDINDYNNGFAEAKNGNWPGVSSRDYGGEKWDKAMAVESKPGAVILGYNDVAPLLGGPSSLPTNSMAEIIQLFEQELRALTSVPSSERRQLAWMSANVKFADRASSPSDPRWVALHASAVDKNYYYYVPQKKDTGRPVRPAVTDPSNPNAFITYETRFGSVFRNTPVFRVPRLTGSGQWGVTNPGVRDLDDWQFNYKNFATPVSIPGLTYSKGRL